MKKIPRRPLQEDHIQRSDQSTLSDLEPIIYDEQSAIRAAPVLAFGSHEERVILLWFMEKVAVLASRWAAPGFWKEILPRASHAHPALKQCLVALLLTDYAISGDKTVSPLFDDWRGLRSYYRAIEIFNRLPSITSVSSLETLLIASTTFWTFDLRNRRPGLAALYLQATTRLLKQMKEMQRDKSQLVLDVEEMLNGFAAAAVDEEPPTSTPTTSFKPQRTATSPSASCYSSGDSVAFKSIQHARASLSRCIWALNLARNAEAEAQILPVSALEKLVFTESVHPTTDFTSPPYSSLTQCRGLLNKWHSRLSWTSDNVPGIEKRILLLHAKMTGWLLWRVLDKMKKNLGEETAKDISGIDEEDENILTGFLDEIQKLVKARYV